MLQGAGSKWTRRHPGGPTCSWCCWCTDHTYQRWGLTLRPMAWIRSRNTASSEEALELSSTHSDAFGNESDVNRPNIEILFPKASREIWWHCLHSCSSPSITLYRMRFWLFGVFTAKSINKLHLGSTTCTQRSQSCNPASLTTPEQSLQGITRCCSGKGFPKSQTLLPVQAESNACCWDHQ